MLPPHNVAKIYTREGQYHILLLNAFQSTMILQGFAFLLAGDLDKVLSSNCFKLWRRGLVMSSPFSIIQGKKSQHSG